MILPYCGVELHVPRVCVPFSHLRVLVIACFFDVIAVIASGDASFCRTVVQNCMLRVFACPSLIYGVLVIAWFFDDIAVIASGEASFRRTVVQNCMPPAFACPSRVYGVLVIDCLFR